MKTAKPIIQAHDGTAERRATFNEAFAFLQQNGEVALTTSAGTEFATRAADSRKGAVIRFFQRGTEFARAYQCCWDHYYNCNRTRIGMYCDAVDSMVSEKGR